MALSIFHHSSQALGMQMTMEVILPDIGPVWDGVSPLPALYLLHGNGDDQSIWQRRTSLERYVAEKALAVFLPTTHMGAYTNQAYGFPYFDYLTQELPQLAEAYFPLAHGRRNTFIGGLSMGGYGALKAAMGCPGQYGAVFALSPGCDRFLMLPPAARELTSLEALKEIRHTLPAAQYQQAVHFFLNFGSPKAYTESAADNLYVLAAAYAAKAGEPLPIFITCGTDDFVLESNQRFHRLLQELGVPHDYRETPGTHDWLYWDTHIQTALDWLPL